MKIGRTMRYAVGLSFTLGAFVFGSRLALADALSHPPPEASDSEKIQDEQISEQALEEQEIPKIAAEEITSDGSMIEFIHLGMAIEGVSGWQGMKNGPTMSLVLQDPKQEITKIGKDEFKFQRNLTVVARHHARPIDHKAIEEVTLELTEAMKKDAVASDFQIVESRLIDHRGKNDALMIYSAMKIGSVPMVQLHILVSGASNHFLMTYTDMAERFNADRTTFDMVWKSMMSISVQGRAPQRYYDLMVYGGGALSGLLLLTILSAARRRRIGRAYANLADSVYEDDQLSKAANSEDPISMVWNLGQSDDGHNRPEGVVTGALSAEKTKQAMTDHNVSSVSNYF